MSATILCIEDEPEIREDIADELRDAGYTVFEAGDGRAGLEAAVRHKPDLVLSDISMPVMSGFDFLRTLRAEHPDLADMPVVFLSALADRKDVIEGKKLGVDDYLTKPIDFEMMLATVEIRLSQVNRMARQRDQQLVKLYRALNPEEAAASHADAAVAAVAHECPLSIVMVGNDEIDLNEVRDALQARGHRVKVLGSGRKLVEVLQEETPDLVLISLHTMDLAATTVVKLIDDAERESVRTILLVPREWSERVNPDSATTFDGVFVLPHDGDALLRRVREIGGEIGTTSE